MGCISTGQAQHSAEDLQVWSKHALGSIGWEIFKLKAADYEILLGCNNNSSLYIEIISTCTSQRLMDIQYSTAYLLLCMLLIIVMCMCCYCNVTLINETFYISGCGFPLLELKISGLSLQNCLALTRHFKCFLVELHLRSHNNLYRYWSDNRG